MVFAVEISFDDSILHSFYYEIEKQIFTAMDEEEKLEKLLLETESIKDANDLYFNHQFDQKNVFEYLFRSGSAKNALYLKL